MFILTVKNSAGQIVHKKNFESGSFVIGRDDSCDLVIVSAGVSRKHARIFTQQTRCLIEDLASANGIIVDGQKVVGQRDLGTASQIQIGEHFLFLHQNDAKFDIGATLFVTDDDQHCKLVRINDGFAGEEYNLSEVGNTIGRIDENFILLSDNSISRHHAQITRTGFIYNLSDLQSSNGTKLNGKKIKKSVELTPGDRIEFGNLQFVFVMGGTEVNLQDYREVKSSPLPYVIVGALIFLTGLFIAFANNDEVTKKVPQKIEEGESFTVKKQRALALIDAKEYAKAIYLLRELRAVENGLEINTLLDNAISAEKSGKLLNQANEFIEAGDYSNAIEILKSVEKNTPARKVADGQIEKLENMLATKYKNEAEKLMFEGTRKSLKKAHNAMRKALSIRRTDPKWITQIRTIEARLKKEKISFLKWKKP